MLAVAVFAAGACADASAPSVGDEPPESNPAEASPTTSETPSAPVEPTPSGETTEVDPCSLLKPAELRDLAGKRVSSPKQTNFQGIPQCRWGQVQGTLVQVQAAPSADWSVSVEAILGQLVANPSLSASDVKEAKQAQRELSKRGALNAGQACRVFSLIAEIGGAGNGENSVVSFIPAGKDTVAVSAQACTDGRFTSVTFRKPGLQQSAKVAQRASTALAVAHNRAIAKAR